MLFILNNTMVASNYLRITLYTVFLLYNNDKLLYNADIFRENSEIIDSSLLIFNQHILSNYFKDNYTFDLPIFP